MAGSKTDSALRRLVIVESPAKAKTIAGYLGAGYDVEASVGHIRDLAQPSELPAEMKKGPFGKFAVDVDSGFEPYYVVDIDKRKNFVDMRLRWILQYRDFSQSGPVLPCDCFRLQNREELLSEFPIEH